MDLPLPLSPEPSQKQPKKPPLPSIDRALDVKSAAEFGRRRFEKETALQQKIKGTRAEQSASSQKAMKKAEEEKKAGAKKTKEFRSAMKQRDLGIAEDKARREKQTAEYLAGQKTRAEKRKKEKDYMGQLHDMAQIKQSADRRIALLEAEKVAERRKAELQHRLVMERAAREEAQEKEAADKEARERKTAIANELSTAEYQLEVWRRMKLADHERELRSYLSKLPSLMTPTQSRMCSEAAIRIHQKNIADEFKERKEVMELGAERKRTDADNVLRTRRSRAESVRRQACTNAEGQLARSYEDIDIRYRKRMKGEDVA